MIVKLTQDLARGFKPWKDMFHENVNVLEYAAISKNVKTFNPQRNLALSKSARKREGRSKSALKDKNSKDAE